MLYHMLVEPLLPQIQGAEHLIIAPDGQLNLIPFGALVTPKGEYLLQDFEITYVASGRDLLRGPAAVSSGDVIVFADPIYDLQRAAVLKDARMRSILRAEPELSENRDPTTAKFSGKSYERLPNTAREAEAVLEEIPRAKVTTREHATEAAVKSVRRPLVLHLATHGFVLGTSKDPARSNAMLRSGLLLAGVTQGTSGPEQDGVLTAMEMSTLDLTGTELVVLSACETGLGDWRLGDGVYGLRRALFLAGAASEVISLWQVQDDATADLMGGFYHALAAHVPRGEALRRAQLSVAHSAGGRSHPFYWAGFELSGAWGPVDLAPLKVPTPLSRGAVQ
jgi:CHAT domain-containing protein